jgi:hypothetical protein
MNREGHEVVSFFVGTEVEHTPAYGLKTLFVVGIQDASVILNMVQQNACDHVYFGANQSFPQLETNDIAGWCEWENMIQECLQQKLLCTLDFDVACVEGILESSFVEYHNFIPMISVKLPYINQLGYNATVKLDDRDFAATNPGVWCHSLHALQKRSVFTDWSKYTKDKVIK